MKSMRLLPRCWRRFGSRFRYLTQKSIAYLLLFLLGICPVALSTHAQAPREAEAQNKMKPLLRQSQLFYERGEYQNAIALLQRAIAEFAAKGEKLNGAIAWGNLCLVYQQMGEWQRAKEAIESSFSLLEDFPSQPAKIFASLLEVRAKLNLNLEDAEDALQDWQQAEQIYRQQGELSLALKSVVFQSIALKTLGQYRAMEQLLLSQAENFYRLSDSAIKALALRHLGLAVSGASDRENLERLFAPILPPDRREKQDKIELARQILKESLKIAETLDLPQEKAEAYLSLGNLERRAYYRTKDAYERIVLMNNKPSEQAYFKDTALAYYQKSRKIAPSILTQIEAQLNQISLLLEVEKRTEPELNPTAAARELNTQLQNLEALKSRITSLPPSRPALEARLNLAHVLIEKEPLKYRAEIEALLQDVKTQAVTLKNEKLESYAWGYSGELEGKLASVARALNSTQQALLLSEAAGANSIRYQWEWQLGKLHAEQKNFAEAITLYEQTIETLDAVRYDLLSSRNPDTRFTFRDNIEPVYREYSELLFKEISAKNRPNQQQTNLKKARHILEKLQIAELEDYLRCRLQQEDKERPNSVDRAIEKQNLKAAIIHITAFSDRLEAILKLPQHPELQQITLPINASELESIIEAFKKAAARETKPIQYSALNQLYNILFAPLAPELQNNGIETLVPILDRPLQGLPLAALYDGEQFLIEQYNIALTLSLDYLQAEPLDLERDRILVAGVSQATQNYPPLQGVDNFARSLRETSGTSTELMLNENFTAAAFKTALNQQKFPVVHLATHGQFSSSPEETFILAWNEEKLDLWRLGQYFQNLQQSLQLLVLDACQTAVGDRRAVLGIAGLSVQAGARSTIASLSRIPDRSTSILMEEFYRQLRQPHATKAEALRRAQLKLLNEPEYSEPYAWSPYVLVGNWN